MQIQNSWQGILEAEFKKPYFGEILKKLDMLEKSGVEIFPPRNSIFNALNLTPFESVKVVILGQDPYHKKNLANGLSFSVPKSEKIPPSLKNIFKELNADLGVKIPENGDLSLWAKRGVLLLNAVLSVSSGVANSHKNFGWENFTNAVISAISAKKENVVFMLWGNYAQGKISLINPNRHLILTAAHPSPLARGAFFGSKHFSKCNEYLKFHGKTPIIWDLTQ